MDLVIFIVFFAALYYVLSHYLNSLEAERLDPKRSIIPDKPLTRKRLDQLRNARDSWMEKNHVWNVTSSKNGHVTCHKCTG